MKNDSNMLSFNNRGEFSKVVCCDILEEASGQMCVQWVCVCMCVYNCRQMWNLWGLNNTCASEMQSCAKISDCSRIAEESLHEAKDTTNRAVGQDAWSTSEFHMNFNVVNLIVFTLEQHLKVQPHPAVHKHTETVPTWKSNMKRKTAYTLKSPQHPMQLPR